MSLHPRRPAALLRAPPRRLGSTALSSSPPRGSCSGPSRSRCAASCLSSAARRRCGIPRWCSSSRRCPSAHILLAILPSLPAPDRTISTAISTAKCPRSHRPRIRQQPCHRPYQYSPVNADRPIVSSIRSSDTTAQSPGKRPNHQGVSATIRLDDRLERIVRCPLRRVEAPSQAPPSFHQLRNHFASGDRLVRIHVHGKLVRGPRRIDGERQGGVEAERQPMRRRVVPVPGERATGAFRSTAIRLR